MTINWEDAPEGASYYRAPVWYMVVGKDAYYHLYPGRWQICSVGADYITPANGFTPRPVVEAWDTKELPPVGTVCEVLEGEVWHQCEIVARVKDSDYLVAIYQRGTDWGSDFVPQHFRPIQNDRARAIEEMVDIYYKHSEGYSNVRFGALYDAGWRKQP